LPACQGGEHPGVRMSMYQQPWHGSPKRKSTEQHGSCTYERHGKTSEGQKVHWGDKYMEECYKSEKIHIMSKKSRVQRLESYFYEVDVWSPKTAKRND
jgi:hypothetical protein